MIKNSIQQRPEGGLLQTRGWAAFMRALGRDTVVITRGRLLIFGVIHELPYVGRYLYIPRGTKDVMRHISHIRAAALRRGCAWVRIEPLETQRACDGCVEAPHDMQPRCVLQLDITPDEDTLLTQMKGKTRYNIRLAQKKGVVIHAYRHGDDGADEALDAFVTLVHATARRKHVHFHPANYYKEMFAHVGHESGTDIVLYTAVYNDEVVAANLVTICNGTATYLHGATSDKYRNVMAPFLLQWRQIVDARKQGCAWYDFGGVFIGSNDIGKVGISRFKKGFAPRSVPLCVPGTYDIPLKKSCYILYRFLGSVKKLYHKMHHLR